MKEPNRKVNKDITVHKDNTVSYWCIYEQIWRRTPFDSITIETFASFNQDERKRIKKATERL